MSDEWRKRIKAGVICQRLQAHLDGKLDLSPTQLQAANILLRKVVPDLQRTTIAGDNDQPIAFTIVKPW